MSRETPRIPQVPDPSATRPPYADTPEDQAELEQVRRAVERANGEYVSPFAGAGPDFSRAITFNDEMDDDDGPSIIEPLPAPVIKRRVAPTPPPPPPVNAARARSRDQKRAAAWLVGGLAVFAGIVGGLLFL